MIHKADINRIAKKVLRHRKGVRDHHLIHPAREWFIGIVASICIVVGAGYWSVVTYTSINNRSVEAVVTPSTEVVVYRTELVTAALEKFGERATTFEELLTSSVVPTFPVPEAVPELTPIETATTAEPVVEEIPLEENAPANAEVETVTEPGSIQAF